MNTASFRLQWEGEEEGPQISLDAVVDSNNEDAELCAWARSASIGSACQRGGGAAPVCTVRRVA